MEETNQAENSSDNITSFSRQSRSSKMIQAAAPYLDSDTRKTLDIFVKFSDFMDVIQNLRQQGGLNVFGRKKTDSKDNTVSATGLSGLQGLFGFGGKEGSINFEGILKSIRPYCSTTEISIVDNVLNIFNMKRFMEMYQNMSGMMNTPGSMNTPGMMNMPGMMNLPNIMNMMKGFPFEGTPPGSPQANSPTQGNHSTVSPSNLSAPSAASINNDNSYYESTSPTPYDLLYQAMYGQSPPSDNLTQTANTTSPVMTQSRYINQPPYDNGNKYKDVTSAPYDTSGITPYRDINSAADAARKGNSSKLTQNVAKAANTQSQQSVNQTAARPNNQQMFDMIASMVPPEQKSTFESMKKMFESGMFMPT